LSSNLILLSRLELRQIVRVRVMKLPPSTVRKHAEAKGRPALPPAHSGLPEQAVKQPPEAPARPPAEHPALFLSKVLGF
jgi:hypothetical protein